MTTGRAREQRVHAHAVQDWYAVLGIPQNATDEAVGIAVERLSRQASALANTVPERSQQLRDTVRAIRVDLLSGPQARQRYDGLLAAHRQEPAGPQLVAPRPPSTTSTVAAPTAGSTHQTSNLAEQPTQTAWTSAEAPPKIIDAVAAAVIPMATRFRRFIQSGWTCPACGGECEPDDRFCAKCGTSIRPDPSTKLKCRNCSVDLTPADRFCGRCGTPVH